MRLHILSSVVFAFICTISYGQKTYFIKTERETQSLKIDGIDWDGEAFFTLPSDDGYHQVIVSEEGFKKEYDILHEDMGHKFTTTQVINVDTNVIAVVKPIELNFKKEDFDFKTYQTDYQSYVKDIVHDGLLHESYSPVKDEMSLLNKMKAKNQYLINELNEYHNNPIGRYRFYTLATINGVKLYEVHFNENDKFIQVFVNVDWSITAKNTEDLPQYNYTGESGKLLFPKTEASQEEILSLAINDAIFSSLLNFLSDQQINLISRI